MARRGSTGLLLGFQRNGGNFFSGGASFKNRFQWVQRRAPRTHHVANRFGERDVIGNAESRYEVGVGLTRDESVIRSSGDLVPELSKKSLFVAVVKSHRVCEATDSGASPSFQGTLAVP